MKKRSFSINQIFIKSYDSSFSFVLRKIDEVVILFINRNSIKGLVNIFDWIISWLILCLELKLQTQYTQNFVQNYPKLVLFGLLA